MLAEVLLVLAGHPSSFFVPHPSTHPSTYRLAPALSKYLHPGEITTLDALGDIAFNYASIRQWCAKQLETTRQSIITSSSRKGKGRATDQTVNNDGSQCVYASTLASGILDLLRQYETDIVELEMKVLAMDPGIVQDDKGYVPLSILTAALGSWTAPLGSLKALIDAVQRNRPSPGALIDMVNGSMDTGHPQLRAIYETLSSSLQTLFIRHLVAFALFGQAAAVSSRISPSIALDTGPDPLSPRHRTYALNEDLVPSSIGPSTRESLMYIGRVVATLKREGRELPRTMVQELRLAFEDVLQNQPGRNARGLAGLDGAVVLARREVGEWLWRHVLTGSQIVDALDSFGNYCLTRRADHAIGVVQELTKIRRERLILADPSSSSSIIRDADLQLGWLRASVGTSAEYDKALDGFRLKLDNGPIRPLTALPSGHTHPSRRTASHNDSVGALFSDLVMGAPMTLHPTISWPLDLFITPAARTTYTEIHAYLLSLRMTHQRVLGCWALLSSARKRTRLDSNDQTTQEREHIRTTWAVVRLLLFFLDELLSHFMVDIIDVQHRTLLEQLSPSDGESGIKRSGSVPGSLRGSTRLGDPRTTDVDERRTRAGSPASTYAAETVRSRIPPTPNKHTAHMDFLTLRQLHGRHLAFLKQGLLLGDQEIAVIIRGILDTAIRFCSLIERWAGDLLPTVSGEQEDGERADTVSERFTVVNELAADIHERLADFFRALVETQNPTATTSDSANGASISFSRTARATQMVQSSRVMSRQVSYNAATRPAAKRGMSRAEIERSERGQEAENLMGRHIEQLLLRLDYNGVMTSWLHEEHAVTQSGVLAEGGL